MGSVQIVVMRANHANKVKLQTKQDRRCVRCAHQVHLRLVVPMAKMVGQYAKNVVKEHMRWLGVVCRAKKVKVNTLLVLIFAKHVKLEHIPILKASQYVYNVHLAKQLVPTTIPIVLCATLGSTQMYLANTNAMHVKRE